LKRYRYVDHAASADASFEAFGSNIEELFTAAADATMNVMVNDLTTIAQEKDIRLELSNTELDLLLFDFLNELLFYKDAQHLLLRVKTLTIRRQDSNFMADAVVSGEEADPGKHQLMVDVKAVTLHKFSVEHTADNWKATVILDI
jgi:SHS2 domain-containing protein